MMHSMVQASNMYGAECGEVFVHSMVGSMVVVVVAVVQGMMHVMVKGMGQSEVVQGSFWAFGWSGA